MEWQPIDTAPTGWVNVILFEPDEWGALPFVGYHDEEENVWRSANGSLVEPTHWMPLPPPPVNS